MIRFFARRALHAVVLLLGVSILSFLLMQMTPGDFFSEMRLNPQISSETLAGLRRQYGLDQPLPLRYVAWLKSTAKGELGFSFAYNRPVAGLLWRRARNTLLLTVLALFFSWSLAIPLGVWSAARVGHWDDKVTGGATTLLLATPELLLALLLLMLAVRSGYLPTGEMVSLDFAEMTFWQKAKDLSLHLLLPVAALTLAALPVLVRHVRATMVETLRAPYIRATRAYGISRNRMLFRHALPAAINPLVTLFGFSIAGLLSGSLLVEVIMSWPGLGPLLLEAILARDVYVVIGIIMVSTLFLLVGMFVSDVLLALFDPRIRVQPTP